MLMWQGGERGTLQQYRLRESGVDQRHSGWGWREGGGKHLPPTTMKSNDSDISAVVRLMFMARSNATKVLWSFILNEGTIRP